MSTCRHFFLIEETFSCVVSNSRHFCLSTIRHFSRTVAVGFVSTIRHFALLPLAPVNEAFLQAEVENVLIRQLPDFVLAIPLSTHCFDALPDFNLTAMNVNTYPLVHRNLAGVRLPRGFFDNDLDSFKPSAFLRIISVAGTEQVFTLQLHKLFGAQLIRRRRSLTFLPL